MAAKPVKVGPRDMEKESFWRRQVESFSGWDGRIVDYCRRRGIRPDHFYWRRRELARRDRQAAAAAAEASAFLPVKLMAATPSVEAFTPASPCLEIMLPGDRSLRLTGPVDMALLAGVPDLLGIGHSGGR